MFIAVFPELTKPVTQLMYIAADCCWQTHFFWCWASYRTAHFLYKYCINCTVCNWTVLTVITHKLPLHVQLHNITAHLLYKYCTNSTFYNWTVLTVITHKLPLHVQLHNKRATAKVMSSELRCKRLFEMIWSHFIREQILHIHANVSKRSIAIWHW